MNLLAQADLGSLKADFVKSLLVFGVAMLVATSFVAVAVFAWLQYRLEKKSKEKEEKRDRESKPREVSPQPFVTERAPKRYNHDLAENRHNEVERRLNEHDDEIKRLSDAIGTVTSEVSKQLNDMPERIITQIVNAAKIGRKND